MHLKFCNHSCTGTTKQNSCSVHSWKGRSYKTVNTFYWVTLHMHSLDALKRTKNQSQDDSLGLKLHTWFTGTKKLQYLLPCCEQKSGAFKLLSKFSLFSFPLQQILMHCRSLWHLRVSSEFDYMTRQLMLFTYGCMLSSFRSMPSLLSCCLLQILTLPPTCENSSRFIGFWNIQTSLATFSPLKSPLLSILKLALNFSRSSWPFWHSLRNAMWLAD